MNTSKYVVLQISVLFFSSLFFSGCLENVEEVRLGNAYSAKEICSGIYVSNLDESKVANEFVAPVVTPLDSIWSIKVDDDEHIVQVGRLNSAARAMYREGLGCTCMIDVKKEDLLAQQPYLLEKHLPEDLPWPHGKGGIDPNATFDIDYDEINAAIDEAFEENKENMRNTTSVLVAYKGKLIAEKYAEGFDAFTRVPGFSLSKSVTSALIGILEAKGSIHIKDSAPVNEWQRKDQGAITIENLLHMSSGLDWMSEEDDIMADYAPMAYQSSSYSEYVLQKELIAVPGETFNYSSGDTIILSKIIQETVGGTLADAYNFYQTQLFHKIDITSAIVEGDSSGYFNGATGISMTPRDWARFGLLYLQKGMWNNEEVVPARWIEYSTTPSPANKHYGAQIWLNNPEPENTLPEDTYYFLGFYNQVVRVVPSKDLIIVRTGYNFEGDGGTINLSNRIAAAVP